MGRTRFLISIICFFLFSQNSFALLARSTSFDDRGKCEAGKGVWRQFGNGCANSCESQFEEFLVCTKSLVYACDCGKNRCWDGDSCVSNSSYKEIYDKQKAEEKKVLDAAKEKRKAAVKSNVEALMAKFRPQSSQNNNTVQTQNNQPAVDYSKERESNIVINQPEQPQVSVVPNNQTNNQVNQPDNKIIQNVEANKNTQNSNDKKDVLGRMEEFDPNKDIPPLYLKKQAQKNQEQNNSSDSSSTNLPPGLPVVPLPK